MNFLPSKISMCNFCHLVRNFFPYSQATDRPCLTALPTAVWLKTVVEFSLRFLSFLLPSFLPFSPCDMQQAGSTAGSSQSAFHTTTGVIFLPLWEILAIQCSKTIENTVGYVVSCIYQLLMIMIPGYINYHQPQRFLTWYENLLLRQAIRNIVTSRLFTHIKSSGENVGVC